MSDAPPQLSPEEFLRAFYGRVEYQGYFNLLFLSDWRLNDAGKYVAERIDYAALGCSDDGIAEAAAEVVGRVAGGWDCYFSIGLCSERPSRRGTEDETTAVLSLSLELDVKEGAFASTEEALSALRGSGLPEPTLLVNSGSGGVHVHWFLEEPWVFLDAAEKQQCKDVMRGMAKAISGTIDPPNKVTAVYRIPGTLHTKSGSRPVAVIGGSGAVYHPSEFADYADGAGSGGGGSAVIGDAPLVADLPDAAEVFQKFYSSGGYYARLVSDGWSMGEFGDKYPSRSEAVLGAASSLEWGGASAAEVCALLTDRRYGISDRCWEKGDSWGRGDRQSVVNWLWKNCVGRLFAENDAVLALFRTGREGLRQLYDDAWAMRRLNRIRRQNLPVYETARMDCAGANGERNGQVLQRFERALDDATQQARDVNLPAGAQETGGRPTVILPNDGQYAIKMESVISDLMNGYDERDPSIMNRSERNYTVVEGSDNNLRLRPLNDGGIKLALSRMADWFVETQQGILDSDPPPWFIQGLLSMDREVFPGIDRLVRVPVFLPNGAVSNEAGLYTEHRMLYRPDPKLIVPRVADHPSDGDLRVATELFEFIMKEFPFDHETDEIYWANKLNFVSMILEPFARCIMREGTNTPISLFDAHQPGSGKGLLSETGLSIGFGTPVQAVSYTTDDEELQKRLVTWLDEGRGYLMVDNVKVKMDSGALSAMLTAQSYGGRRLGKSESIQVVNNLTIVVTGNNVTMHPELVRRTAWIRLAPNDENHHLRTFSTDLPEWRAENRGDLIWACLTLLRRWFSDGRPLVPMERRVHIGSFQPWVDLISGVLDCAYGGDIGRHYMKNMEKMKSMVIADDHHNTRVFLEVVYNKKGDAWLKPSEIGRIYGVADIPLGDSSLETATEKNIGSKMSVWLRGLAGRPYGPFTVERAQDKSGTLYRIVKK